MRSRPAAAGLGVVLLSLTGCEGRSPWSMVGSVRTVGVVVVAVVVGFAWSWRWLDRARPRRGGDHQVAPVARVVLIGVLAAIPPGACGLALAAGHDLGPATGASGGSLVDRAVARAFVVVVAAVVVAVVLGWGRLLSAIWLGRLRAILAAVVGLGSAAIALAHGALGGDPEPVVVVVAVWAWVGLAAGATVLVVGARRGPLPGA